MNPIFPSILSTDYFDLYAHLEEFRSRHIDFIHLDVMDGHFVDNISFGPSAAAAVKSQFEFKIDSHLMVDNPTKMIPKFIDSGSDWISFHIETGDRLEENISLIKSRGLKAGIVLNPDTGVETAFPYLKKLDYILLMSVFPGYGGQEFMESTVEKVEALNRERRRQDGRFLIQVDGGINASNIGSLKKAGADLFVIGTYLYGSDNIQKTLETVLNKINGDKK